MENRCRSLSRPVCNIIAARCSARRTRTGVGGRLHGFGKRFFHQRVVSGQELHRHALDVSGIDSYAYLRDVLTKLPSMTNWQIKHVTPEAWAKTSRAFQRQSRHSPYHKRHSRGYDVYGRIIRIMSIRRLA